MRWESRPSTARRRTGFAFELAFARSHRFWPASELSSATAGLVNVVYAPKGRDHGHSLLPRLSRTTPNGRFCATGNLGRTMSPRKPLSRSRLAPRPANCARATRSELKWSASPMIELETARRTSPPLSRLAEASPFALRAELGQYHHWRPLIGFVGLACAAMRSEEIRWRSQRAGIVLQKKAPHGGLTDAGQTACPGPWEDKRAKPSKRRSTPDCSTQTKRRRVAATIGAHRPCSERKGNSLAFFASTKAVSPILGSI